MKVFCRFKCLLGFRPFAFEVRTFSDFWVSSVYLALALLPLRCAPLWTSRLVFVAWGGFAEAFAC